ncbi:14346_t:CDS:1, partial [Entrophospora sp. SA101]
MDVTSEHYEPFNEAEDNEGFDTGNMSNDTRDNLGSNRNIIGKIRNKKSKTWDYFEDDGNNIK